MTFRILFCLVLAAPAVLAAQERYGFVARLGRDTVSVERVTRTANKLISDEIERFPRVVQRHTEILLGADDRPRHFEMDILMPSAVTPKWHERHVVAEYIGDSVRFTVKNGVGTETGMFGGGGGPMLPWSSQVYSLTELFFAAAGHLSGDSVSLGLYYVDAQGDEFGGLRQIKSVGFVRALPGGKAEVFRHDGLSGAGEATLDPTHRMLSYSGARSTFKMEVERIAAPDVDAIARGFIETERKQGVVAEMSLRDTMRARVGAADLLVDYGRPLARGRELLGHVIPFDAVWRTGANAATQFTTSAPIRLAGLDLEAGTYTFWTLPTRDGVQLIVNRQFKQWGTQYDSTRDLGRAALGVETVGTPVDKFTISVVTGNGGNGTLVFEWGTFRWTAPIVSGR